LLKDTAGETFSGKTRHPDSRQVAHNSGRPRLLRRRLDACARVPPVETSRVGETERRSR
jgi:hypothetical protein